MDFKTIISGIKNGILPAFAGAIAGGYAVLIGVVPATLMGLPTATLTAGALFTVVFLEAQAE